MSASLPEFQPETIRAYRLACARERLEHCWEIPAYREGLDEMGIPESCIPRVSNRFLKGFMLAVAIGLVGQVFAVWAIARLVWR